MVSPLMHRHHRHYCIGHNYNHNLEQHIHTYAAMFPRKTNFVKMLKYYDLKSSENMAAFT